MSFQGVSCTGSMITEGWDICTELLFTSIDSDWVITAHHCIEMNNNFKPHRKGQGLIRVENKIF